MTDHRTRRSIAGAVALAFGLGALITGATSSVSQPTGHGDPGPALEMAPFGPGEKAEYQVKLGGIGVGSGTMEILGVEDVDGARTYHARLHVKGGIPLARVDTRMDSWLDVQGLFSRRFEQDQHEIRYKRYRIFDFYPESRMYRQRDTGEIRQLASERPLDDVSFLYYARTLPLEVGDEYTLNRYYKDDGNPVVLKVLRKETIEVPAGRFNTIVVQPIIQTDGLFGEGGEAEVYFTDDDRRILVFLRSKVPIVGSLSLHLRQYEEGDSLPIRIDR